jgi:hypothetical protein
VPSVNRRYAPTELRFKRPPAARGDESRAPVVLMVSGGAKPYVTFKVEHTSVVAEQDSADTIKDLKTCLLLMAASKRESERSTH